MGLAIFQLPDANAVKTEDRIINKMEELKKGFPEDVDYEIGFNTVPYTRESIKEVLYTLLHAIVLVRAATENAIALFTVRGGEIADPFVLRFDELAGQPRSAEQILREIVESTPVPV